MRPVVCFRGPCPANQQVPEFRGPSEAQSCHYRLCLCKSLVCLHSGVGGRLHFFIGCFLVAKVLAEFLCPDFVFIGEVLKLLQLGLDGR